MKHKGTVNQWAFWIGAIIAILVGILTAAKPGYVTSKWIPVVLVLLGLVVGLVNITTKEMTNFLVAAIVLMAFGAGGLTTLDTLIPKLGTLLGSMIQAFSFFIGAAAVIAAIKEAWLLASKK